MTFSVSKAFQWVLRLGLAGIFLFYGLGKPLNPQGFADSISAYQLAPWWVVNAVALVLPWVEIVAALVLVFGPWRREAATLMAGMIVLFIGGVSSALLRGLDINCGCSVSGGTPVSWQYVGIQSAMLLAAAFLIITNRSTPKVAETQYCAKCGATVE